MGQKLTVKMVGKSEFTEIENAESVNITPSGVLTLKSGDEVMFFSPLVWEAAKLK